MAKYIDIKGLSIQTTDTDPEAYGGSWASGNNMNTGRTYHAGAGIQTSALATGGLVSGSSGSNAGSPGTNFWASTGDSHFQGAKNINAPTDGVAGTDKNLPPYYSLAYIMRTS